MDCKSEGEIIVEPLRTFALSCVKQAETRVYEGQPYTPWENPYKHSLPPAPDKPKRPQKPRKVSSTPMSTRKNMALVRTPDGKHKWMLSGEAIAEIRKRIVVREPLWQIAQSMGVAHSRITALARDIRQGEPVVAATVDVEQAGPSAIAMAARFAFEVRALPMPVTRTARVSTEPRSGTHVIDWAARLDRIEFDGTPGQGKPKSGKARKCSSTADFRHVYPCPHAHATHTNANPSPAHAINCAAPGHDRHRASTKSSQNPFKTGQKGKLFAGEKVFETESQWRTACCTA